MSHIREQNIGTKIYIIKYFGKGNEENIGSRQENLKIMCPVISILKNILQIMKLTCKTANLKKENTNRL